MFDSDFDNIAQLLLPINLRKLRIIAWMKVFISQVNRLKAIFLTYRTDSLFLITHNSQVASIEHFLNSKYNPSGTANDLSYEGNGIYITDVNPGSQVYLRNDSEQGSLTYLYNDAENAADTYLYNAVELPNRAGFIVNVPDTFNIDLIELIGFVNKLRLAGKKVTVKTYTP